MITLTLTPQELAVINKALMLAPYGEVAPVVQSINQQLVIDCYNKLLEK